MLGSPICLGLASSDQFTSLQTASMDLFARLVQDAFTLWGTNEKFFTELPNFHGGEL